jgi:uncharacterized membrane protein YphA (DoxX/SURF4 family)
LWAARADLGAQVAKNLLMKGRIGRHPRVVLSVPAIMARMGRQEAGGIDMLRTIAIVVARLVFGGLFLMAVSFKVMDMTATAGYIASAGFPMALPLAYLAAVFETLLVLAFFSGAFFSEAALLAAVYVVFLAFAFHGPARWSGNQAEFGFFVDHFTFFTGLLLAAAIGPGRYALNWAVIRWGTSVSRP